jgi:hypothetical protein
MNTDIDTPHSDERPGLCYPQRPGSDMADHLRGWFRARELIAYTLEPYHEVDADAFGAASQALACDFRGFEGVMLSEVVGGFLGEGRAVARPSPMRD